MRTIITAVSRQHWYARGIKRMSAEFARVSSGYEQLFFVEELPPGAPDNIVEDGFDFTAYVAKPFALQRAMDLGADIGLLLDCAFFPIRDIAPLIDHIAKCGFFACDNGSVAGLWSSDRAAVLLGLSRDQLMQIPEVSSYCVGISRHSPKAMAMLRDWVEMAKVRGLFEGPHTAGYPGEPNKRNPGFVSHDPRVLGHRQDQLALTIAAWRNGCTETVRRPIFTAYAHGYDGDPRTVLLNQGL